MARPSGRNIRSEVIEVATQAIQTRGAAGFSYGTIADELGIKAPTIHHHFRHKADLLGAAVVQYRAGLRDRVEALDARGGRARLEAYAAMFLAAAKGGSACLCGAVVAEWHAVGVATRAEVEGFFDEQVAWLANDVRRAIDAGEFSPLVEAETFAAAFMAALQGALLLARVFDDPGAVPAAASCLLDLAAIATDDS